MKEATLTSAHVAETFQSVINWNALKSNVAILVHKVINLVVCTRFALFVGVLASIVGFYATLFSDTVFMWSIITATIALSRVIIPMVKGGDK